MRAAALAPRSAYYRADDNFSVLLGFEGGAVATLLYTAMGDTQQAKEQMDAYCDGEIHRLDDYRRLTSSREASPLLETRQAEKGLRQELEVFHAALIGGKWPIPLWQQLQAMDIALRVNEQFGARA